MYYFFSGYPRQGWRVHELWRPCHELPYLPSDQGTSSQGDFKVDIPVSRLPGNTLRRRQSLSSKHNIGILGQKSLSSARKTRKSPYNIRTLFFFLISFRSVTSASTSLRKFTGTCLSFTPNTGPIVSSSKPEYRKINRSASNSYKEDFFKNAACMLC